MFCFLFFFLFSFFSSLESVFICNMDYIESLLLLLLCLTLNGRIKKWIMFRSFLFFFIFSSCLQEWSVFSNRLQLNEQLFSHVWIKLRPAIRLYQTIRFFFSSFHLVQFLLLLWLLKWSLIYIYNMSISNRQATL